MFKMYFENSYTGSLINGIRLGMSIDDFPPHTRDFNRELGGNGCFSRIPMV